jgi:hypothetical protein
LSSKKARPLISLFFSIRRDYLHTFSPLIDLQGILDSDQRVMIESMSVMKRYQSCDSIYSEGLNNSTITINAYFSVIIYVGMEYFGRKLQDGRFIRIVIKKLDLKSKSSSLPDSIKRSIYYSLPLIEIILIRDCIYSLFVAFLYLLQILN